MADDVVSFSPAPGVNIQTDQNPVAPAMSGVQLGMQLAQKKEELDSHRQALEAQKEQIRQHAISGAFDMLPKLQKAKGKPRDMMFDIFKQRMEAAGVYVDPSLKDLMGTQNPEAIPRLNAAIRSNPKLLQDSNFMSYAANVLGDPEKYMEWEQSFVKPLQEEGGKTERAVLAGDYGQQRVDTQVQGRLQGIDAKAKADRDLFLQKAAINPADYDGQNGAEAQQSAQAKFQDFISRPLDIKQQQADAAATTADARTTNADTNKGKLQETIRHNKATEGLKAQDIAARKDFFSARFGTQKANSLNRIFSTVEKDPNVGKATTLIGSADGVLVRLNRPQVLKRDIIEANAEVNRLITNANSMPVTRERGLNFESYATSFRDILDKLVDQKETAAVDPGEVAVVKQRLTDLRGKLAELKDATANRMIGTRVESGVLQPQEGQAFLDWMSQRKQFIPGTQGQTRFKPGAAPGVNPGPAQAPATPQAGQLKIATPAILDKAKALKAKGMSVDQINQALAPAGFQINPGDL